MGKVAEKIAAKAEQALTMPSSDTLIEMAGDLLGATAIAHNLPVDFDGCAITILREPETNKLSAVILSPVDMHGDEPFARYAVEPDRIIAPRAPKIVLAG